MDIILIIIAIIAVIAIIAFISRKRKPRALPFEQEDHTDLLDSKWKNHFEDEQSDFPNRNN